MKEEFVVRPGVGPASAERIGPQEFHTPGRGVVEGADVSASDAVNSRPPKAGQREEVETDKRRAMTPARKLRIWTAWQGKCWFCKMPVDQEGPGVVYDHIPTLWISGSDDDNDIGPIHAATCNKIKTAADATKIAKTKRQKAKNDGTFPPSKFRLKSRGFDRGDRAGWKG